MSSRTRVRMGGGLTHVQVGVGHLLQLLAGRVEPFKDDGVCSFAVEDPPAIGAADWRKNRDQNQEPFQAAGGASCTFSPMTDIRLRTLLKSRMARSW